MLFDADTSTIWRWESGKSNIPDHAKKLLASHYGVPIAYLMRWDEDEPEAAA